MAVLIATRGLPGCGKTTAARAWVAGDRANRARVNRDDIRSMLDNGEYIKSVTESRVLTVRDALIKELLRRNISVICDDTNLPTRTIRELMQLARNADAEFEVKDMTDVMLWEASLLNRERDDKDPVPQEVLDDMYARYIKGKDYPLPLPDMAAESTLIEPYSNDDPSLPECVLVDIDGTVALMGDRNPYDETRVREDLPNKPVISLVKGLMGFREDPKVIFMSGRTKGCSDDTVDWLDKHIGRKFWSHLYMREVGDSRKDWKVKLELFNTHIRDKYRVRYVLDDRNQVVQLWRSLGLTCFQVATGDF